MSSKLCNYCFVTNRFVKCVNKTASWKLALLYLFLDYGSRLIELESSIMVQAGTRHSPRNSPGVAVKSLCYFIGLRISDFGSRLIELESSIMVQAGSLHYFVRARCRTWSYVFFSHKPRC